MTTDKNAFDDRRRAQEEEYFRKKEQELLEKMRERAAADAARTEMSEATGVEDSAILQSLQELGYTRDSVMLLHLVPLVRVAWIDGGVTSRERELILDIAARRGVTAGSPAYEQLINWLDRRPPEDFFDDSCRIIRVLMKAGGDVDGATPSDLVALCTQVAKASGGIFGLGNKISDEEQALIEQLAHDFDEHKPDAAHEVIEKL